MINRPPHIDRKSVVRLIISACILVLTLVLILFSSNRGSLFESFVIGISGGALATLLIQLLDAWLERLQGQKRVLDLLNDLVLYARDGIKNVSDYKKHRYGLLKRYTAVRQTVHYLFDVELKNKVNIACFDIVQDVYTNEDFDIFKGHIDELIKLIKQINEAQAKGN